MLFTSYEFLFLFLPVTLLFYYGLLHFKHLRLSIGCLTIASLLFYSYWNFHYVFLLLASISFNYVSGMLLSKYKHKLLLFCCIFVNFGLLAYFKYTGFFLTNLNTLLNSSIFIPSIVLPLGISFFTFTQTAYLVDSYRGEIKEYNPLNYSLFVTIFPHLIAGPILYHKTILPQFTDPKRLTFSQENMSRGIFLFSLGLGKKILIADTIASYVNTIFEHTHSLTFVQAWIGALGYSLQLYYDFSGYSEMAIGLGLMLNFILPWNFNSPYRAASIIDFWKRWHITLSAFLKNYLYIPLGGNRHGEVNRLRNLLITMLLGGLWHGAGWTFLIWGGLHGLYLVINHTWRRLSYSLPQLLAWPLTMLCVITAWVFFRAAHITDALFIIKAMYKIPTSLPAFLPPAKEGLELLGLLLLMVITARWENSQQLCSRFKPGLAYLGISLLVLLIALLKSNETASFLYFQF